MLYFSVCVIFVLYFSACENFVLYFTVCGIFMLYFSHFYFPFVLYYTYLDFLFFNCLFEIIFHLFEIFGLLE